MSREWCEKVSPPSGKGFEAFLDRLFCTEGQTNAPASYVYCAIVFIATIGALCLKEWGVGNGLENAPVIDKCECNACVEDQVVMRVSCGFFFWFSVLTVLCGVLPGHIAADIYYSWWCAKVSACLVICTGFFFVPNGFFEGYSYFASVLSGFFMLLQVMVLLDWAYAWNETWRGKDEADRCTCWRRGLVLCSLLLLVGALALAGSMFYWFDCPLGIVPTALNMLGWMACTLLSITVWCQHGSLIASAVIAFNVQLITMTGLYNNSDASCNRLLGDDSSADDGQIIASLLLAAVGVTKAAWTSVSEHERAVGKGSAKPDVSFNLSAGGAAAASSEDTNEHHRVLWRYLGILALAMCYMGMLLTKWGVNMSNSCDSNDLDNIGMWVNLCTSWVVLLLYFWSLIAPKVLTGRDFGLEPAKTKSMTPYV